MTNQVVLDELLEKVIKMSDEEVERFISELQTHESQDATSEAEVLYVPEQVYQPGPAIEEGGSVSDAFEVKNGNIYYWRRSPHTFFVSCKPDDELCEQIMKEIIGELRRCHIAVVAAPGQAQRHGCLLYDHGHMSAAYIDVAIVVGGDGSLLYISSLFPTTCPPVVSFNAGSLGFLTPFPSVNIQAALQQVLNGPLVVTNRNRLNAYISGGQKRKAEFQGDPDSIHSNSKSTYYSQSTSQLQRSTSNPNIILLGPNSIGNPHLTGYGHSAIGHPLQSHSFHGHNHQQAKQNESCIPENNNRYLFPVQRYQCALGTKVYTALNEVYLYREGNYMTNLQCYASGYYFGTVQADGLLVSTATGSTAHALSAGGAPLHPEVPALLLTPVCPHVMSSKQLLLPHIPLKIKVSLHSRGSTLVCFDGKHSTPLQLGQSVVIYKAPYDLLTVALTNGTVDWFGALKRCLNWNVRIEQKQMHKHGQEVAEEKTREVGDPDSDLE